MKIPEICTELAEETGWHIGDGSMNFYSREGKSRGIYQLRGHIEDDREHYLARIKPLFKKLYDLDISLREMLSTRVFGFQIWNNELVNFKKGLGLPLGKKFDIAIPSVFLENKELTIAVIRGIFDTDGSINLEKKNSKLYPRVYITTICPTLASQLLELFNKLGIRATKYSQLANKEFNRQREYRVTIRGEEMLVKFMKIIKPQNPKHTAKYKKFLDSKSL
ncbi:MAG TPA: LAGLIDADG family homing endonuclease [Candidatus Paceibacterota bacterium]|nr:LAGLIDADG family homing endonuclease [Candidatus Paceibacterota bacterium]